MRRAGGAAAALAGVLLLGAAPRGACMSGLGDARRAGVRGSEGTDRAALTELYRTTNGAGWRHSVGWGSGSPVCRWHGVQCAGGRVFRLLLARNKLTGHIDHWRCEATLGARRGSRGTTDSPGNLPSLQFSGYARCDLGSNQFTCPLPDGAADSCRATCIYRDEKHALRQLYLLGHGPHWERNENWLSPT
eukprot:gene3049-16751_t